MGESWLTATPVRGYSRSQRSSGIPSHAESSPRVLLDEQRHAGRAALLNGGLRPMDLAWLAVRDTTDRLWTIPIRGGGLCAERARPGRRRPAASGNTTV